MGTGNNHIKPVHNIVDEAFNTTHALSYHLSVQLGKDDLSFCILDLEHNKYLVLKSFNFSQVSNWAQLTKATGEIILQEELLAKRYKTTTIALNHNQFTLVPAPLFDITKQKDYLSYNADMDPFSLMHNDVLKSMEARNIFSVYQPLEKLLRKHFGSCNITHHTSALIEGLINKYKNNSEELLLLNVNPTFFDLIIINGNNKLKCCNMFYYQSNEDLIYYLLFVCEQFKLNPEKIKLLLSGTIEKHSSLYSTLHNYIRTIHFMPRNDRFLYSYKFDELPSNFYYGLFSQYQG